MSDERQAEREDAMRMAGGKTREMRVQVTLTATIVVPRHFGVEDIGLTNVLDNCDPDWEIVEI